MAKGSFSNLYNTYVKLQNQKIREKKQRTTEDNIKLTQEMNDEIEIEIEKIENFHKNVQFKTFDFNNYYDSQISALNFKTYVPLEIPSELKLRKELKCLNKNFLLEIIFKSRKQKRIDRGLLFEQKWEQMCSDYQKEEEKRITEYTELKNKKIQEIESQNNNVKNKKIAFLNNDPHEVGLAIIYYVSNSELSGYSIGCNKISISFNEETCSLTLDYSFEKPLEIIPKVKKYTYLKTKFELKESYFSNLEQEKIFENIVFNSALYYTSMISYAFLGKINEIIVNCFVNDLNRATGNYEDKYIMSALFDQQKINYENIQFIEGKAFFDYVDAKYNLPLMDLKTIVPYSNSGINNFELIENNMDGIEFEKVSKAILENNGFENVVLTKSSGDYGADIVAEKEKVKYAIQCKKYSSKVGVNAVQEVIASREIYKCHIGAILTNNYFTPNAKKLAQENKIILWDKDELLKMLKNCNIQNNSN